MDAALPDSEVAFIGRSKRDIAEYFGVAWSTMQPRLVGKISAKVMDNQRMGLAEASLSEHVQLSHAVGHGGVHVLDLLARCCRFSLPRECAANHQTISSSSYSWLSARRANKRT